MNHHQIIVLVTLVATICSCSLKNAVVDAPIVPNQDNDFNIIFSSDTSRAKIGEKFRNPYNISVMREAYQNLTGVTKSLAEEEIAPTHNYVCFRPACDRDIVCLDRYFDQQLHLTPLDHEISDGWVELDPRPEFSTNGYQHRWAYISIDKDLSALECPYDILYQAFDPDLCPKTKNGTSRVTPAELEYEAYTICGRDPGFNPNMPHLSASYHPHGSVTYRDTVLHCYTGCKGMSVWAIRGLKETYDHCADDGSFSCSKTFSNNFEYRVYFNRSDFEIWKDSTTVVPCYVKSNTHSALNLRYNTNMGNDAASHVFYMEILKAMCYYYFDIIDGLSRPPFDDEINGKLYCQAVNDRDWSSDHCLGFFDRTQPLIRVYRDRPNGTYCPSDVVIGTTFHELAHAAHWQHYNRSYPNTSSIVKESFAAGVELYLTKKLYPSYTRQYFNNYSGIVEDMIDNDSFYASTLTQGDYVTGYSIAEIEAALSGGYNWYDWYNNLYSMYPNKADRGNLLDLFNYWEY